LVSLFLAGNSSGPHHFKQTAPTAVHFFMNRFRREGFIKHARTAAFDSSQLRGAVVEG
jgi:hypothetical protein